MVFWRTSALSRGRWVRAADEPLLDAVGSVHGYRDVDATDAGIIDFGSFDQVELAGGTPYRAIDAARGARRGRLVPSVVEVEGLRSLARATVVVAWLGARRLRAWLRSLATRK